MDKPVDSNNKDKNKIKSQQNGLQEYIIQIDEQGNLTILPSSNKYTHVLIFIHGLAMKPVDFLQYFLDSPLIEISNNFKIVIPQAPVRFVTYCNKNYASWFDIKTYENSFERPFDEAFSSEQVEEQFVNAELKQLNNDASKLFLGGFSQGCGMSIHVGHHLPYQFGGIVGIAGYLFSITNYDPNKKIPICIICGLDDKRRPWSEIQKSYNNKIEMNNIKLVEGMGHEMTSRNAQVIMTNFLKSQAKL